MNKSCECLDKRDKQILRTFLSGELDAKDRKESIKPYTSYYDDKRHIKDIMDIIESIPHCNK